MNEQTINLYKQAFNKIMKAQNILLVTHQRPDGDALSSICAMIEFMKINNKSFFAYSQDEPAKTFNFLPNIELINFDVKMKKLPEEQLANFGSFDLIIVLDCGSVSRTNLGIEISKRQPNQFVIEFDHHPKISDYANLEIRDTKISATAELVYYFFKINQVRINRNMANCILTGILTDTANFLYPSTSEMTVKISSEMMSLGAKLPQITENTLRNKSLAAMRLWGKIMSSLQINPKYNFATTILTKADMAEHAVDPEELEGISGFLSNLYGVNGIMLLQESGNGIIRGNLRTSSPDVDLSKLARMLGGGGHAKASGFTIEGEMVKTEEGWKIK
ncbi:MAG: DHH family protein [Parcubacteria group bacterium GW2011_GWE2_39_37]|uniref:DHH family protein n=1 Tax=Candidatus Falkowbacteria bacterium GW2011_GWF2_39_8 TaxID=1618642 RepID=A0A0G0T7U2_9BACT|nr:MAG: DHH family protein [Parcubacteria group bacterium GW2011_GWE2_39_37]KKR33937.1 MAG: DHH family protein [Candidatus Falkowbacteria bacterium GW2011_GWF2_39_8]